ncbi:PLP-dependent aminotransferase family protein [Acinetobacter qingfengensis]|uniref:GntR family transcriptional regulator n=1 Tax=Acinetobacter qingfengensis TaxID=1262585 RepID=A0A1E7R7H7_9GAMM|nr:PLP-dependent aminotransferase family protein [Acinetobacter qingfengensis]KAA8731458.1 PLP-dependent aminotransferase family protein [Acinetobacter qingfengensis]OEY95314.1 GntR family transcriptional regulator [Acinetobacter qingfengensis]
MQQPWKIRLHLEEREEKTIFFKLANQIIQEILSGRLGQGTRLPGSRTLSDELGINRKTVQSVYEDLEAQGWLISKPRQGTFVSRYLPDLNVKSEVSIAHPVTKIPIRASKKDVIKNDGIPDTRLIPYELFSRAYRHALIQATRHQSMGYGDPQGSIELRQALLNMLSMERFIQTQIEQICVVRGSQMGIFLAARILAKQRQGEVIVVEEWSYPPAVETFLSHHFQIIRVGLDQYGLDTENLMEIITKHKVVAVYTTPHHQYPTTVTMSMDRRLKLLDLSKIFNFYIIEDDYDHEFHYDSRPIPPLISLPSADYVIHIGSLSKVFAPSLRVGYVVADLNIIQAMKQDILLIDKQGNAITELAIAELMQQGEIRRHTRKMRKIYQSRRDFALMTFEQVFKNVVEISTPAGGMALWVKFKFMYQPHYGEILKKLNIDSEYEFSSKNDITLEYGFYIRFGFAALTEIEISTIIRELYQGFCL